MLQSLTKETWEIHLNGAFQADIDAGRSLEMRLIEVSGYGRRPDAAREAYSLVFRGPKQPLLAQCIYSLRHELMGQLEIFLVPIGPDSEGMRYEAIFT